MLSLRFAAIMLLAVLFVRAGAKTQGQAPKPETSAGAKAPHNVPETCPVTKPSDPAFVPPSPYPAKPSGGDFWFGSGRLWTVLGTAGTWSGLPHYTPNDPTFRQKLFFWREGYDYRAEPQPKLTITGRRLEGPAPPLLADQASGGWHDDSFMVTAINIPALGCWEITGHYEDQNLSFVVWVTR